MNVFRSIYAVFEGFRLCFFDKDIRKLAARPWKFGGVVYILCLVAAYYLHSPILQWMVGTPVGFIAQLLYYITWAVVALLLVVAVLVVSLVIVMVTSSVFQTSIVVRVLTGVGVDLPKEISGVGETAKEITRTARIELTKFIWLVPLALIFVIVGFIPLLAPIALLGASWIFAYESIDVVLDIFRIDLRKRFFFATSNFVSITVFGLCLTTLGLIPFFGFLLPPVAAAGAAWMMQNSEIVKLRTSSKQ